jgi:CheY-like chemotaxis protein
MNELTPTILLVDDNEDDLFALRRALKKAGIANPQQVVTDGQQAIDYLAGVGQFADRAQFPLPFLVFLDLKMPFRGGFEVLSWIREQPALASMVVIVLTGSDETKDHQRAHALGARSYLVKPPQPADLRAIMESMESFWSRPSEGSPIVQT